MLMKKLYYDTIIGVTLICVLDTRLWFGHQLEQGEAFLVPA